MNKTTSFTGKLIRDVLRRHGYSQAQAAREIVKRGFYSSNATNVAASISQVVLNRRSIPSRLARGLAAICDNDSALLTALMPNNRYSADWYELCRTEREYLLHYHGEKALQFAYEGAVERITRLFTMEHPVHRHKILERLDTVLEELKQDKGLEDRVAAYESHMRGQGTSS